MIHVFRERTWEAFDLLDSLDRWRALVELTAKSYPPAAPKLTPARLEEELDRAAAIAGLEEYVVELADELNQRFAAAERARNPIVASPSMCALLFLPLMRTGGALEERWERLIYVTDEPHTRELLGRLPTNQAGSIITNFVATWDNARSALNKGMGVADLAPCPELGAALRDRLGELERRGGVPRSVMKKSRAQLDALFEAHPQLG